MKQGITTLWLLASLLLGQTAKVIARSRAFVDWHRGALPWKAAIRSGDIAVRGRRSIVRSLPSWNLGEPTAVRTPA